MKAISIKGKSSEEIQYALQQSLADNFNPTLAIAFVSIYQNRDEICKIFNDAGVAVFGVTTNGSFIDDEVELQGASIILLDIDPACFTILIEAYPEKNYRDVARKLATKTLEKFQHPAFLIAGSHVETDAEQLLFGFEDVIGKEVNIHGCMAGDDFTFSEQFVFTNTQETNRAL